MVLSSTKCKELLNISTSVTTYDSAIALYLPIVTEDISEIAGHRWHKSYEWIYNDGWYFSSTGKTITVASNSTYNLQEKFQAGDTIDVFGSYFNDGYYTISSIGTSHVITVSESLVDEYSTTYNITSYIYRCNFPEWLKRIASKMVWYNISSSNNTNGDIQSESWGGYSVTYKNSDSRNFGLYPSNLISGIKKKIGSR